MASALYAADPESRLTAAARVGKRERRGLDKQAAGWPPDSPGALNAWLLMVTTKAPGWRDPYVEWRELPPSLGCPHEGFFYPDPLGFWAEVRHWATTLVGQPMTESVSVTTMLHGGEHLAWALELMRPRVVLFLDEPAWRASAVTVTQRSHTMRDPYRSGQLYEGWWGTTENDLIIGKAPQHPAAHKLYRRVDMDAFLRASPSAADQSISAG